MKTLREMKDLRATADAAYTQWKAPDTNESTYNSASASYKAAYEVYTVELAHDVAGGRLLLPLTPWTPGRS